MSSILNLVYNFFVGLGDLVIRGFNKLISLFKPKPKPERLVYPTREPGNYYRIKYSDDGLSDIIYEPKHTRVSIIIPEVEPLPIQARDYKPYRMYSVYTEVASKDWFKEVATLGKEIIRRQTKGE